MTNSTHGIEVNGANYLVSIDGLWDQSDLETEMIPLNALLNALRQTYKLLANCRETFLGSSAAVQQESEGVPVLIFNATEVETRLDASESTSSVEPQ
jgi:hypothetical protein